MSINITKTCPYCHGNGHHMHYCNACGGRGVIQTRYGIARCSQCGGHGVVVGEKCNHCHGHGIIEQPHTISLRIPAGANEKWSTIVSLDKNGNNKIRVYPEWQPHPSLKRRGSNLYYSTTIPLKEVCNYIINPYYQIGTFRNKYLNSNVIGQFIQLFSFFSFLQD